MELNFDFQASGEDRLREREGERDGEGRDKGKHPVMEGTPMDAGRKVRKATTYIWQEQPRTTEGRNGRCKPRQTSLATSHNYCSHLIASIYHFLSSHFIHNY